MCKDTRSIRNSMQTTEKMPRHVSMLAETSKPVKRQQSVWVAAPSDEVHSTQELLEVRQDSQGVGRLEGIGRVEVFSHSRTELKHIQRKEGDCLVS